MPAPITREYIERVLALLAEGGTNRGIARETGGSRASVQQIAIGKLRPADRLPAAEHARKTGRRRAVRCSTCGGMVRPPCRVCGLRREMGLC